MVEVPRDGTVVLLRKWNGVKGGGENTEVFAGSYREDIVRSCPWELYMPNKVTSVPCQYFDEDMLWGWSPLPTIYGRRHSDDPDV